ncbi:MAG: pyrroline-5-carboxylate reductase [Phycisphaerae bacterium]|nr:pyrroline-5-carboxylate reductase [Phycisphaerae bacterium]
MSTFAVCGYGNMGQAVVEGAVRAGVLAASDVLAIEPDATRRGDAERFGCRVSADAADARDAPEVLLAVKPQSFPELARRLTTRSCRTTFISVMAGLSGRRILDAIGDRTAHAVIRAMPNTPCRLGLGVTGIALSEGAAPGDDGLAMRLFAAVGRTVRVPEGMLDAVTATSGSGPAYLFLLAEAWERGARDLGFDQATARELVRQTIVGAARMLEDRSADAADLRAAVTSKGGTTAAALAVLEARGFADAMREALAAAERRGRELGT